MPMMEIIGEWIVCDRETARKLWTDEPEKRPFIYLETEFKAMLHLDTVDVESIELLKQRPEGFVYKKGMDLLTATNSKKQ